jgi:hypothetical protein
MNAFVLETFESRGKFLEGHYPVIYGSREKKHKVKPCLSHSKSDAYLGQDFVLQKRDEGSHDSSLSSDECKPIMTREQTI